MTIIFLMFIFILCLFPIIAQETDHVKVELDKTYNGNLEADNAYFFYQIKIPDDIQANSTDLVFRVKELDIADVGKADFSDPDIYVSKVIIFNMKNSTKFNLLIF